ncbi:MAG TPA: hypothetical protein VMK16_02670 [Acidimicrobiales bacterium]|nr:hypothetical protein [Acidimicrobiales bacterium]
MSRRAGPDGAIIDAAIKGARSVGVYGWHGEECAAAALERIVRYPPRGVVDAFRQGRWAAHDELRRLTGGRSARVRMRQVPWPKVDDDPIDFDANHPFFVWLSYAHERRDSCRRGHVLAEVGVSSSGGCAECKRASNREWARRRRRAAA